VILDRTMIEEGFEQGEKIRRKKNLLFIFRLDFSFGGEKKNAKSKKKTKSGGFQSFGMSFNLFSSDEYNYKG